MKAKKISNYSYKGGIGKTTLSIAQTKTGDYLNKKVCVFDFDRQSNLSDTINYNKVYNQYSTYDLLCNYEVNIKDMIIKVNENISLIQASEDSIIIEDKLSELKEKYNVDQILQERLKEIEAEYDLIIFDLPSTGNRITENVLTAIDEIYIPTDLDEWTIKGLVKIMKQLISFKEKSESLKLGKIIINNIKPLGNLSADEKNILNSIESQFSESIFKPYINENKKLKTFTKDITDFSILNSNAIANKKTKEILFALSEEVFK